METKDFGDVEIRMALIDVGEESFYVKSFIDDDGDTWFLVSDLTYQLGYDAPDKDCIEFQQSICDELCCRYHQLYKVLFDE